MPCHPVGTRALSSITRCSQLILCFPSPGPQTSHFSTEPSTFQWRMVFSEQDVVAGDAMPITTELPLFPRPSTLHLYLFVYKHIKSHEFTDTSNFKTAQDSFSPVCIFVTPFLASEKPGPIIHNVSTCSTLKHTKYFQDC